MHTYAIMFFTNLGFVGLVCISPVLICLPTNAISSNDCSSLVYGAHKTTGHACLKAKCIGVCGIDEYHRTGGLISTATTGITNLTTT